MKKLTIVICVMIVILVILMASAICLFTVLLKLPNARGLLVVQIDDQSSSQIDPQYRRKIVYVENTGKETVFITRFYDENNDTLWTIPNADPYSYHWNGTCYALFSGKYILVYMVAQQLYSQEIYAEFPDGYKCRLWKFS